MRLALEKRVLRLEAVIAEHLFVLFSQTDTVKHQHACSLPSQGRLRPTPLRLPACLPLAAPALTISMILVLRPVFLFKVNMYWASTTPATTAHTLALATAPTRATAARSMGRPACARRDSAKTGGSQPRGAAPRRTLTRSSAPRGGDRGGPAQERRGRGSGAETTCPVPGTPPLPQGRDFL